jgi:dTDP-4-amino-4,6-dideoxygalactose transaminase
MEHAVWLPSGRAGIAWALRAAISRDTHVIGPAFTCSVVHEAMVRSGGQPVFIDAAQDSFHMDMDAAALSAARATANHALVLSEPYGHTYALETLNQPSLHAPRIRIVDSAMAVPVPELFRRLQANDFAVVSFGAGKNSFAGWGAVGLTHNAALAQAVRKHRDQTLWPATTKLHWRRGVNIGLRTAAQHPAIFSATRKLWYWSRTVRHQSAAPQPANATVASGFPAAWSDESQLSSEWRSPSTSVDRQLALRNLTTNAPNHSRRLELATRYHELLHGVRGIQLPPTSAFALSHFTIRVPDGKRDALKAGLLERGVYTINLWAFDTALDPQQFPATTRLCSEVLNLPLSQWMRVRDVDRVCDRLTDCLT